MWDGTYRLFSPEPILRNADGSPFHCEDPFLWRSPRGWHLLAHSKQSRHDDTSVYAFSLDGRNWTVSPLVPYDCTLRFTDGSTAHAGGCGNRPQLAFDDALGRVWLVTASYGANPSGGRGSWTVFRELQSHAPSAAGSHGHGAGVKGA